ncbi:hypothetical protein L3X38_037351 [Prunus dulcis]|uniref:Uncharacterized protein n=1 Tax=Prunus dulcis TaxID=3755 RepID=A0AAD4V4H0_PRUDU|nr:hypothetical protein L3X38_037351 [Prunus dulcis]
MVYGDLASIWGKNTSYFHKVANHKAKTNFMHGILDAQNHLQYDYQKMTQRALNLDFTRDKVEATLQSMAPTKSQDDSLLICDAEPRQVTELKWIFRIYEEASGQQVNLEKSALCTAGYTSPNSSHVGCSYCPLP